MKIKVQDYSSWMEQYTVKSESKNVSSVIDKMIRLTAKLTERYAGDIYYNIDSLIYCIEHKESYDRILLFSEDSVWAVNTSDIEHFWNNNSHNAIQTWQLAHDPEKVITTFKRINIKEIR